MLILAKQSLRPIRGFASVIAESNMFTDGRGGCVHKGVACFQLHGPVAVQLKQDGTYGPVQSIWELCSKLMIIGNGQIKNSSASLSHSSAF